MAYGVIANNKILILPNTAEIVENERPIKLSPLQLSRV